MTAQSARSILTRRVAGLLEQWQKMHAVKRNTTAIAAAYHKAKAELASLK